MTLKIKMDIAKTDLVLKFIFLTLVLMTMALTTGCATVKGWFVKEEPKTQKTVMKVDGEPVVRYSENGNVLPTASRQYKRVTRQRIEEESEVHAQAGSMWVMEGQGAYLFSQNKTRREGDLLTVKIDGPAQKQIETKVSVIKQLLKQLEDEEKKAKELQKAEQQPPTLAENGQGQRAPAAVPAPVVVEEKKEKEEEIKIDAVPTRIVERQADGNYRIKGQQPFMIGKREYKVIVTGVIRPEDFNDEGLSSSKVLDSQFDVVSLRRKDL